jgi:hypothetical protein
MLGGDRRFGGCATILAHHGIRKTLGFGKTNERVRYAPDPGEMLSDSTRVAQAAQATARTSITYGIVLEEMSMNALLCDRNQFRRICSLLTVTGRAHQVWACARSRSASVTSPVELVRLRSEKTAYLPEAKWVGCGHHSARS